MAFSTDPVIVFGGTSAGGAMAHALRRAGLPCVLIDPDPTDHERLLHFLDRLAAQEDAATRTCIQATPFALTDTIGRVAKSSLILDFSEGGHPPLGKALEDVATAGILATHSDDITDHSVTFRLPAPAHLARMVELGPCADQTGSALQKLAKMLGWQVVQTTQNGLFPTARLTTRLIAEADNLLIHGAIPHEIDEAMVAFGFAIGPYEALDLQGLDSAYAARSRPPEHQGEPHSTIQERMVREGRLGKKSGVGFYRYPGGGGAVIDPLIEDLIREEAHFARIAPQPIPLAAIAPYLIAALVDEGATLLADATLPDAQTLDLISRFALGFPHGRTGLATFANTIGLARILDTLTAPAGPPPLKIGTALASASALL